MWSIKTWLHCTGVKTDQWWTGVKTEVRHTGVKIGRQCTGVKTKLWWTDVKTEVWCTVSVSPSAQDGIAPLGKAHTRSAPSLSSLPKVAFETVPIFVWLNTDRSQPWRVECRLLPFSTPLSFRRSMLWCSGLSMFRKFLMPPSTSALPNCRPDVMSAVLASLSARSFSLLQHTQDSRSTEVFGAEDCAWLCASRGSPF